MRVRHSSTTFLALCLIAGAMSGCKKKVAVAQPPAPPAVQEPAPRPPVPPSVTLTAEPGAIEPGQPATLKWSSTNASEATISGLGAVPVEGRRDVRPEKSTTYEVTVTGAGGTASASATVTIVVPPPPLPPPPVVTRSLEDRLSELSDAYFDFDRSDLREDARGALTKNAESLRAVLGDFPTAVIMVEGHCDERGSAEYNIGLGERRAEVVMDFLKALGVEANRLKPISYGKERPQCTDAAESCRQKNRRAHFAAGVTATN